jgi:DNA-binding CsgD family transcriptional regulator
VHAAGTHLIEREHALESIERAVAAAAGGSGEAVVVEGAPGLGKTELIGAGAQFGRARALKVRLSRGGELEQAMGWGIARELLTGLTRDGGRPVPVAARPALGLGSARGSEDPIAVALALTELCAELSAGAPMLLLVDDAHWADELSLRWLAYLAPRVNEMGLSLIIAARPHDPRRPAALTTLSARDRVSVLGVEPLTVAGAAELVRRTIPSADDALCAASHSASGGNAFLLAELLREIGDHGAPEAPPDLSLLALDRVDRVLARRLNAAGEDAERLARVAALLGTTVELADAGSVAELDDARTRRAADALRAADVITDVSGEQVAFTHPLIRSAAQRSIAPGERSELHLRAARHLAEHGHTIDRIGVHLLAVEPGSDRWVRGQLISAGDAALRNGAPANAIALYQRATAERAGRPDPELLAKLGRAAMAVDPSAAEQPLRAALEETSAAEDKVPLALDLSIVLQTLRKPFEAVQMLEELNEQLRAATAPRGLQLRVEAELLAQAFFDARTAHIAPNRLPAIVSTLTGADDEEALIVVQQVVQAISYGTAAEAGELAERAWAGGRLQQLAGSPVTPAVMWIPYVRLYLDDYDWTAALMHEWLEQARDEGSAVLAAFAYAILGEAQWRGGLLRDAHASALAAWAIARDLGPTFPGWWIAIGALAQALLAIGSPTDAFSLFADNGMLDGPPQEIMLMPMPRIIRGEVLIANGERERGVRELLEAHAWLQLRRAPSPGAYRFYATLVDGLLSLERRDEAADVARAWLRRTRRFGALSTRGMAERALALTRTGDAHLDGLATAERTLAASPARVEHARGLLELGAALRRARRRTDSREPLRAALDLATQSGARALAERAMVELKASGARPRRMVLTGVDALTPSERRVAQLAASGLTNREIGASLFITRKTVERHLAGIYLKLGTNDRTALGAFVS